MLQRANWKVVGILAVMTTAGVLMLTWPSLAQQNIDRAPAYGQQGTKRDQASDTQPDLKRTAEELAKLKQYLDMLKADYDAKAAQLKDAQKKPATIEQRLSDIEHKLDQIIAALGKKGPMTYGNATTPPTPPTTPVPLERNLAPEQDPPFQPPQPAKESSLTPAVPAKALRQS
jgi:hypothetical protein